MVLRQLVLSVAKRLLKQFRSLL